MLILNITAKIIKKHSEFSCYANSNTFVQIDLDKHRCMGVCIFGDAKMFAQILSWFSQTTYKQQVLMFRLKRTIVKKIKVSACLITNCQISVTNHFKR